MNLSIHHIFSCNSLLSLFKLSTIKVTLNYKITNSNSVSVSLAVDYLFDSTLIYLLVSILADLILTFGGFLTSSALCYYECTE